MSNHLSRHVDNDDARHYSFARFSGLPRGYFDTRADRITGHAVSIAMTLVAVFIVCGLAFGWLK